MLAPRPEASKPRPRKKLRAELNTSSRTKTSREDRKKDKKPSSVKQVESKIKQMLALDELLLPKIFSEELIEEMLENDSSEKCPRRQRTYTVAITLALFVQQALMKDCSCKQVVTMFNRNRKEQQLRQVSTNTTSYCEARSRIPYSLVASLFDRTAVIAAESMTDEQLWFGRRVLLVDGLVVNAPDTPENQKIYPQPHSQKAGMGFSQIRGCASICLATGVITDMQYGPVEGKKTGEATLFRQMFKGLKRGSLIVADSNFESYRDMATLKAKGIDMVCDKNGSRESPFSGTCQLIEEIDRVLPRPEFDKSRFTREEWDSLPATITVRMIRCRVGGRKSEITLVTTLLDREAYPAMEIVKLYRLRWECELDIRSMKTLMGMAWLSCHTPEMLQRELMIYVLAYNIIRITMCDAAKMRGCQPRDLAFKNAKDSWLSFGQDGYDANNYAWLLWSIADAPLRKRPGRKEPRKIKRRFGNKYEKLDMPRALEKAALPT